MIGDHQTLNILFKDARFNGWSIGEIFAVDPQLVPNARRDNFEKNTAYFFLIEQMMPLAAKITKTIRSTSAARNHELSAVLKAVDDMRTETNQALDSGVSSSQKGILTGNLSRAQSLLGGISASGEADAYFREIAFEELDMLLGRIKGATSYKALNTIEHLSTTEKHILEKVFNILVSTEQENAPRIIDKILDGFAK